MAVIDLRNTTVTIYDGKDLDDTVGPTAFDFTAAESDLTISPLIMASPDAPLTITFVDPGGTEALSLVLVGRDITVNLQTSSGTVLTNPNLLISALAQDAAISALISIAATAGQDGTGILNDKTVTTLSNPNSITVTIGDGNFTYSEKRPVEFKLDRGTLNTVRTADEEPLDVSFDFTWEEITAATGASIPTVEDALKRLGLASAWYNASADPCEPPSVNVSIDNDPTCASVEKEVTEIEGFYQENLDHDPDAGQVSCTGRANTQYARSVRVTS